MPETTPLIKAALNLRVGAGFDVYKLSITLSVYKTISIAESDLFLQKMTKKSDLLAANHFFKVHLSLAI
jgi:hypothetical protein